MCILKADNLCKTYRSGDEYIPVLQNLCLEIHKGELTAVMGESGCGKTTLLNLLCGIDTADAGEIYINGEDFASLPDDEMSAFRKKEFGMIFQDFQLLDSLNVKENILVPMILNKRGMEEQETAYSRVMEPLNMKHLEKRNLSEISGGQKQRAAIARAFIHSPSLIFADEPTGSLDANATKNVMEQITEMNQKFGTSILIVTHDPYAASFCHRVLLMKNGTFQDEVRCSSDEKQEKENFRKKIAALLCRMGGL